MVAVCRTPADGIRSLHAVPSPALCVPLLCELYTHSKLNQTPFIDWYWLFPLITAVFAKACFLGLAQGHGNVQVIGLIILEGLLLVIYLVFRPENTKKGDWLSVLLRLLTLIATGLLLVFTTFFNVGGIVKTISESLVLCATHDLL